ncbi:MAG TPA: polysaccharide pyruvyl transferase family protein [Phycisphaerae bacterium]|nr:polysaccharide pyruvyl transferase family protein [Phycisphaerae bacterium]
MRTPRFALYGIGGVYNYGCEAIVRGTEALLHETWPNAKVLYASVRPEEDRRRLDGTHVDIVPRRHCSRYSPRNLARKAASLLGSSWSPLLEHAPWLDACDVVLSIGGDLYTLWPSGARWAYGRTLVRFGDEVRRRGKMYVVWGASIGPFEADPQAKEALAAHLRTVDLITTREPQSTKYLRHLGITDNVVPCADPAFAVPSVPELAGGGNRPLRIGVNLSPLAHRHVRGPALSASIEGDGEAIASIVTRFDRDVVLIPHVVCNFSEADDDLRFLRAVRATIPPRVTNRVQVLDEDAGFLGTGQRMNGCSVVVAARMHCAINALSHLIPTVFLSYSQKAAGMARYVYGHERWVVPISEVNSDRLLAVIDDVLANQDEIRSYLARRLVEIRADARRGVDALAEVIGGR